MSQLARIELIRNSLINSPTTMDKNLYAIVASFTTDEWAAVIKSKEKDLPFYNAIIPFFAYTFSKATADEMISNNLLSVNSCGESLADALFYALSNGSQIKDEQPTFEDICNKPILLNLFNGSIFDYIYKAEFTEDVYSYFRKNFKTVLRNFHNEILINDESKLSPTLALTGNNKLCNVNDFDSEDVQDTLQFIFFLVALRTIADNLKLETVDSESEKLIATLQFQKIIKDSSSSKKEERTRLKSFECGFSYLADSIESEESYELVTSRLNPMMLSDVETAILKSLFAVSNSSVAGCQDELKEDSLIQEEQDIPEDNQPNSVEKKSFLEKIKTTLNSDHSLSSLEKDGKDGRLEDNVAIDDVLIKTKKKSIKPVLIIGTVLLAIFAGYFAASRVHSKIEQQSSVITNAQGGSSTSQYPVIKVTNH